MAVACRCAHLLGMGDALFFAVGRSRRGWWRAFQCCAGARAGVTAITSSARTETGPTEAATAAAPARSRACPRPADITFTDQALPLLPE